MGTLAAGIGDLPLRELLSRYRSRRLSPVEVVDAFLERIEALNPRLNAFVTVTGEQARQEAKEAERRWLQGADVPPLLGIPFSVKDTLPTKGVRTTFGSRLFSDLVPDEDAAAVAALRRAGAILIGKTNSPALGWIGATHNKLFGATANPWDTTVTAGGSSGGAAVAASCALAPINVGTDGGGSLRIPASFTGTVGFKPSYGRVPNYPTGPGWGLQHIGPIARTVEDAAIALDAMSAADERDPYSLPPAGISYARAIEEAPKRLRILFAPDLGYAEAVDPEIADICRQAAARMESLGHEVVEADPRWSSPMETWRTLFVAGVALRLGPFAAERRDDIEDKLLEFIAEGQRLAPDAYYRAWLAKNDWWQQVRATFESYDLVMSPVTACMPFATGLDTPGSIAGQPVSFYGWAPFTVPYNLTGNPAISVPAGRARSGLPVGVQIAGRRFADATVLAVATAYERIYSWSHPPL